MAVIPEDLDRVGKIPWPRPFEGLRGITRTDLPREIFAGFTLAALIIPLNIGYAQVAGLPAAMGLYAAILPLVIFALFTTSRHVAGGPVPRSLHWLPQLFWLFPGAARNYGFRTPWPWP